MNLASFSRLKQSATMYKLIVVSAVLALAAAKPDIITPLGYTSSALLHEPALPVAAHAIPIATPTLRYAAAAPAIATHAIATPAIAAPALRVGAYPAPALSYSAPLAYTGYAPAPAPLPYGYDFGFDYPSYYWKKR